MERCEANRERNIREATIKHQSMANERIHKLLRWTYILRGGHQSFRGGGKEAERRGRVVDEKPLYIYAWKQNS